MVHVENRMVVEGQREQEERYSIPDSEWFKEEYDDVVRLCDIYDCSDCPRKGDDCNGLDEDEDDDEDDDE